MHSSGPEQEFSFHFQTARAFGLGLNLLFWGFPVPLGQTSTFTLYTTQGIRQLVPSGPGLFLIISGCFTTLSCLQQTLVIIQVASQLLPRVILEKTYIEVSHCFWTGLGYLLIPTRTFTDGTTMHSYDTLVAGLFLQSTLIDWWCFFGFTATWILASTTLDLISSLHVYKQ